MADIPLALHRDPYGERILTNIAQQLSPSEAESLADKTLPIF